MGDWKNICNYINGVREWKYKEYYENGQLMRMCNYKNGLRDGKFKSYYKNGQLMRICNYTNILMGEYNTYDGKICNYRDGLYVGYVIIKMDQ